jgi:hypothetical protein
MAVLSDGDRVTVWSNFMRARFGDLSVTKADLRAAVNGLDDYLNTNATAINTAIPQPARSALSTQQKAALLQFVVAQRYLVS